MQYIQWLIRSSFPLLEVLSERMAANVAHRLFTRPFRHRRPAQELAFLAKSHQIRVLMDRVEYPPRRGRYYKRYSWGAGPTILLVHGWSGRASQIAALAGPLVEAGYRVIAYDAPAHGDSSGKRTNILDIERIIREIAADVKGFHAIIGHSFGGVAGAYAMHGGVKSARLITIGSPAKMSFLLSEFARQINASEGTMRRMGDILERRADRRVEHFSLTYLGQQLRVPGLIIHDRADREVTYRQAELLAGAWPEAELVTTEGLGHRRILRDAGVMEKILEFLQPEPVKVAAT